MTEQINIIEEIEIQCAAIGTTLGELCKEAKIDRSTPQRWKEQEPKTIQIYRSLQSALEIIAQRNGKTKHLKKPLSKTR